MAIIGTTCWGHSTGVTESNTRTFADHWTGTGAISGAGDAEIIELDSGEYMESEVVQTGARTIDLYQNLYDITGDDVTLKYRTGAAEDLSGESWTEYTVPFESLGYVQVRLEVEAGGYTLVLNDNPGPDDFFGGFASEVARTYGAVNFTAAGWSPAKIVLSMKKETGQTTNSLASYIYSNKAGDPDAPLALIANGTGSVLDISGWTAGIMYDAEFTFSGVASLTGVYWIVLKAIDPDADNDFIRIFYDTDGVTDHISSYSQTAAEDSWTAWQNGQKYRIAVYTSP